MKSGTRFMKVAAAALCGMLLFNGCAPKADTVMGMNTPALASSRVTVTRIGIFEDLLAYSGRRGIYIITDTKTGKEYIGVSGIGINEIGSHLAGKAAVSDER